MSTDPFYYGAIGFMIILLVSHKGFIIKRMERLYLDIRNIYLDWQHGRLTRKIADLEALDEAVANLTLDIASIQEQSGIWSEIYTTEKNGFVNMSDNKNSKWLSLSIERDGMSATIYRYPLHQFGSLVVECSITAIEAGIKQQYEIADQQ